MRVNSKRGRFDCAVADVCKHPDKTIAITKQKQDGLFVVRSEFMNATLKSFLGIQSVTLARRARFS